MGVWTAFDRGSFWAPRSHEWNYISVCVHSLSVSHSGTGVSSQKPDAARARIGMVRWSLRPVSCVRHCGVEKRSHAA